MQGVLVSNTKRKTSESGRKKVAYVARIIPHYRVEFLNGLEERLKRASIDLTVFSDHTPPESTMVDALDHVNAAVRVPNYYFGFRTILHNRFAESGGNSLRPPYWQPIYRRLLSFDLVIVEQSNSALLNYPLIVRRSLLGGAPRIAFLGHGVNLQRRDAGLRHSIKVAMAGHADHWFVFTDLSADIVRELAVDETIVTTINNSIDTTAVRLASGMDAATRRHKRSRLGLGDAPVAVFCARLSKNKALPFVVESCRAARERLGDFTLLVIGDGYDWTWLQEQARQEAWIRPLGSLYGAEKGETLALADIFLLPSAAGLSILDGFAARLPVLSARFANHGPEIAYLNEGQNGLLTDATVEAYSEAIVRVLSDAQLRKTLAAGADRAADLYSLDAMIENFAQGIEHTLA